MPFLAVALTAVGAGISAYGQFQSARAAEAVANANARTQERNTALQVAGLQAQAAVQRNAAEFNLKMRKKEAEARFSNAASLEAQALAQEAIDRVNLDKRRTEFSKLTASNRARVAASGVVETTGTPLDNAAHLAGLIQRQLEEANYGQSLNRQGIFRQAAMEHLGGKLALAGATLDNYSALAQANLTEASASATAITGQRQADILRLSGQAQSQEMQFRGLGTLFSGGAQIGKDVWQFGQAGAWG